MNKNSDTPIASYLTNMPFGAAFGTKLRFYASGAAGIDPLPAASPSPTYAGSVADSVPQGRWNGDVLDEEGANLLKQAVAKIIAQILMQATKILRASQPEGSL
ncbi:hypothetical protein FB451DRAFT_1394886 [Mycena latifolia]|nr:hypothetical protein FB451DRAFT_1394886 [Mycena latifolia]